MITCTFCKIVEGKLPAQAVYEDNQVIAFAPLEKDIIAKGHLIVVPKSHFADIYDIPQKELANLIGTIKQIALKLKNKFDADGVNLLHASGKAAQQSVTHFHFHLLPRYENDRLDTWPKTGYKELNFREVYSKIKDTLS